MKRFPSPGQNLEMILLMGIFHPIAIVLSVALSASLASAGAKAPNPACPEYIDLDHDGAIAYGMKGYYIAQKLQSTSTHTDGTYSYFDDLLSDKLAASRSMSYYCPGFAKMNRDQRINFWVWTMAAVSKAESDCGAPRFRKEIYDYTARYPRWIVGEYQVESRTKDRRWRGPFCGVDSVASFEANALCALDEIQRQARESRWGAPFGEARIAQMITRSIPEDPTDALPRNTMVARYVIGYPDCAYQGTIAPKRSAKKSSQGNYKKSRRKSRSEAPKRRSRRIPRWSLEMIQKSSPVGISIDSSSIG